MTRASTQELRDQIAAAVEAELDERGVELAGFSEDVCDRLRLVSAEPPPLPDAVPPRARFYDLRGEQTRWHRKTKRRAGRTVVRDPSTVDGIVIHQTAVEYGVSKRQLAASGGDRDLALARRGLNVACHAIAFRAGFFAATHDLRDYVYHGNGFNRRTLGLEIDGRYPGLRDDPKTLPREDLETTWGGEPSKLTDLTIETAREALRWLVNTGREEGMPVRFVYAHRQSSATRRSDPGEALWRAVVLDYGVPTLGLETDSAAVMGDGRAIPQEWAPDGVGGY